MCLIRAAIKKGWIVAGLGCFLLVLFGVLSFYAFTKLFPKIHTLSLYSLFLPDRILTRPSREAYQLPHLPLTMTAFVPVLSSSPNPNRKSCLSSGLAWTISPAVLGNLNFTDSARPCSFSKSPSLYPKSTCSSLPAWPSEMCWCLRQQGFFLTCGKGDKGPTIFFPVGRDKGQTHRQAPTPVLSPPPPHSQA